MGSLNAVHASPTALAHAAPTSQVGMIAAYQGAMLTALAMPATPTPAQIASRNAAIASARADLLGPAANKELTPSVVTAVDRQLSLPASDPTLGVSSSR
jgi:hypothetical protein